ncbi:HEAT repeat domain-containing protein [Hyalangium versicolor]|uniref:HEAT repeat domain-containing protein n=1 Tax=Hyalangium versicolor TaxID=2861190 RepID=UPI001CCF611C|nr:HEAT repeat domain-containing protein [Hyalangium versicolor]
MPLSLLHHPGASAFLRDFHEEHLSEIEFLLQQRTRYLRDAERSWVDLSNVEERLEVHREALHAGGVLSLELAREAMLGGDDAQMLAGAYIVASVQERDGTEELGEVLRTLEEVAADLLGIWEEVLVLSEHPKVSERTSPLLSSPRPEARAVAARILGRRHEGNAERILPLLGDDSLEVRSAAVMALARLNYRPAVTSIENLLQYVPVSEWESLTFAALCLGSPRALQHCRKVCQSGGDIPSGFPRLLAISGDERDLPVLQKLCAHTKLASRALSAVGILGLPSSVPFFIEHLTSNALEVRLAAGAALNLLTGANLRVTTRALEEGAEGDEPGRVIHLPNTDATTWSQWWDGHVPRFAGSRRFRLGKPFSLGVCIEELASPSSPFEARERAAHELRIHSGQAIGFEPDWPVRRQQAAIARWQRWWTDHGSPRSHRP